MIRYLHLEHKFVDDIPEPLDPGFLYISMRYATAVHLCCCGCGREVVTPFSPAQWHITFDGESVSLRPSIGSWNLPCRSHYVIRKGRVLEAPSWSDEEVVHGQARDKRARTAYYASKGVTDVEAKPTAVHAIKARKSWLTKIGDFLRGRP